MEQTFAFLASPAGISNLPIVRETGVALRMGVQHVNAWVQVNNANAIAFTMDALPLSTPASGIIEPTGAGTITFGTGTGATRVCRGLTTTLTSSGQYAFIGWAWDPVTRVFHFYGDVIAT